LNGHDEVRELLELAAVEPGGLDRLEAGDTPSAIIVVGHLAGCPDCLEEMARLRRADTLLRPILVSEPDPALRERTLALVRAVGVARDARPDDGGMPALPVTGTGSPPPVEPVAIGARGAPQRRSVGIPAWAGTLAAALVIGLVGGALLVGSGRPSGDGDVATAFGEVAGETATLLAADDAQELALLDATGKPAGSLVFSRSAGRMLVTATGLAEPAPGTEYRCWVAVGQARASIETMRWSGSVAWWTGDVTIPAGAPAEMAYGVSLADVGSSEPGTVVLTGGP